MIKAKRHDSKLKELTISDILRSKTRFQICNLLNIYRDLSVLDLSRRIGKSKSTIYEHLKKMMDSGFVKISREEKSRSNIYKKYYSWVEKETDETKPEKYSEEYCRYKIEILRSFAVFNQSILKNWIHFLASLEQKIDEGKLEEVIIIFKKMFVNADNTEAFHSIAFYTRENATIFYKKIRELYDEIPDETTREDEENPYYGGLSLLPIKLILDYIGNKNEHINQK
ncbi:MAG: winged helix-turn-helix domain-containing protein [Candidatus Hodarchaeota archaeon]